MDDSKKIIENYLDSAKKQFKYYKDLGEKTFDQLMDAELFWKYQPTNNSIAIIVGHLSGNMLSRWTDFLTTDGEKDWRNRDAEFEDLIDSRADLIASWARGWSCLFLALDSINTDNFGTTIYIRNMGHSIMEAINRQMAHYAYHVGQIVFIGTMIKEDDWKSLSVPKGKSQVYNKDKFSKPKHKEHFTDEILKEKPNDD